MNFANMITLLLRPAAGNQSFFNHLIFSNQSKTVHYFSNQFSTCGNLIDTSNRYCGQALADAKATLDNLEICGKVIIL